MSTRLGIAHALHRIHEQLLAIESDPHAGPDEAAAENALRTLVDVLTADLATAAPRNPIGAPRAV